MSSLRPSPFRELIESTFMIVNKDGETVPFALNDVQARLDAGWTRRNIIPKARQPGVSSYVIARFIAKCLAMQNRTCVIVSHESDATSRLLARAKFILEHLRGADGKPGSLKPVIGTNNVRAITFPKTNSSLWIGTAGSRNFGHGDTISDLHLSEASRYEDAANLVKGLFPAAERGEITVESTGNSVGNWYHRQCIRAREGRGFKLFFFPFTDVPEYALAPPEDFTLDEELDEPALLARGVSLSQLAWRRERINIDFEGDVRAFTESYPLDLDDCFQSTGFSFFRTIHYHQDAAWHRESRHLWVLRGHPAPGLHYVIGADSSGGVERDNAVASIWCLERSEQVAEWVSGSHEADAFGRELAVLGRRFNWAYINGERNNHGLTSVKELLTHYPVHLIHRGSHGGKSPQVVLGRLDDYWTYTSEATRGVLISTGRKLLRESWIVHSEMLKSELGTFVEQDNGKLEADTGCHDDRVFAALEALICVERAAIMTADDNAEKLVANENEYVDPFSFEHIFGRQPEPRELYGMNEIYS